MSTVFAVVNQKGGVGKTTTAVNLATYLALAGAQTLLIDMDAQGNATSGFGIHPKPGQPTCYDVVVEGIPMVSATVSTCVNNLALLPASMDLAGSDLQLMKLESPNLRLKQALQSIREDFDYILIDSPPSLGLLTLNVLSAADSVILPIQTEYYALEGISQLLKTLDMVKQGLNPTLEIGHVILTMYDNRIRLANQVVAEVKKFFGDRVSKTVIPRNVRLSEAPSHGIPVALYDPRSRGARAYYDIAMEIINHGKKRTR